MWVLTFTALLGLCSIAHTQNYKQEIGDHIIKLCALVMINRYGCLADTNLPEEDKLLFLLISVQWNL